MPDQINLNKRRSEATQRYIDSLKDENNQMLPLLKERAQDVCDALQKKLSKQHPTIASGYAFKYSVHKRYIKIEEFTCRKPGSNDFDDSSRSIHAFIDKHNGNMYKPASWRGPAKYARYNLLDDESYRECLSKADHCGGYLYMDRSGKYKS
tara:strand:- start:344 stop:796 length:453 start_codon:yes stop_codon:yes gene_type:complete